MTGVRAPIEQRFWAKVDVRGPDECWPWTGYTNPGGYGMMKIENGPGLVTHISLEISGRPRPVGLHALHSCHNPPCCNEKHLRWGTDAENAADRKASGRPHGSITCPDRIPRGDRHGSATKPHRVSRGDAHYSRKAPEKMARGERNARARLTAADIPAIRASKDRHCDIAKAYGVSRPTITAVKSGLTWGHVE